MVAQELAYASINIDSLTMENRDSFRPQPEGGKDGGFMPGDENSQHLNGGIRVNGPNGGRSIYGDGGNRFGTREGFREQIDFDTEFAAIVATRLGELSMRGGDKEDKPKPDDDDGKTVVRGYDFAE